MAVEKYSIGGTVSETETSEAFADIPQNRVLMAEKLTAIPAGKPQIVHGLTNVEQVFAHFKPNVDIDFENEEGVTKKKRFVLAVWVILVLKALLRKAVLSMI